MEGDLTKTINHYGKLIFCMMTSNRGETKTKIFQINIMRKRMEERDVAFGMMKKIFNIMNKMYERNFTK